MVLFVHYVGWVTFASKINGLVYFSATTQLGGGKLYRILWFFFRYNDKWFCLHIGRTHYLENTFDYKNKTCLHFRDFQAHGCLKKVTYKSMYTRTYIEFNFE